MINNEMNNIHIDRIRQTITVTKAFYKKASLYGSVECKYFEEVQVKYPNYVILINQVKKTDDHMRGLTLEKMERYIENHDDENKSTIAKFYTLCGKVEDKNGFVNRASYGEIKQWFLTLFPEVKENKVQKILNEAKERNINKNESMVA